MKFDFARTKVGAAAIAAFVGGLVLAAGFDLTPFSHAQQVRLANNAPVVPEAKAVGELSNSFVAIAEVVTPAVVSIRSSSRLPERVNRPLQQQRPRVGPDSGPPRQAPPGLPPGFEEFFNNPDFDAQPEPTEASGTGFIVSGDGYILTNNHVVTRNDRTTRQDRVTVTLNDGRSFTANIIGNDSETDVAVLKIDATNLPTVKLGDDTNTRIGEWVLAIGNPLGLDRTVTAGIVSAKGRNEGPLASRYAISDFIQTDAAINPGNSGGPLINIRGEVIGINSAIASRTGYYQGYGFAIPITLARDIMSNLVEFGRIRASVLGVSIGAVRPEDAEAAGLSKISGVLVSSFSDSVSSPAARAGIREGDVIVEVNNREIDRVATLQRTIRSYTPGTTVDVKVMRFGKPMTFKVKLEERPSVDAAPRPTSSIDPVSPNSFDFEKLGVNAVPLTTGWMRENRIAGNAEGLRITDISPNSSTGERLAGLIITDVLNPGPAKAVKTNADLKAVLDRMKNGEVITLKARIIDGTQQRAELSAPFVVNVRIGEK